MPPSLSRNDSFPFGGGLVGVLVGVAILDPVSVTHANIAEGHLLCRLATGRNFPKQECTNFDETNLSKMCDALYQFYFCS